MALTGLTSAFNHGEIHKNSQGQDQLSQLKLLLRTDLAFTFKTNRDSCNFPFSFLILNVHMCKGQLDDSTARVPPHVECAHCGKTQGHYAVMYN